MGFFFPFLPVVTPCQAGASISIFYTTEVIKTHCTVLPLPHPTTTTTTRQLTLKQKEHGKEIKCPYVMMEQFDLAPQTM